MPIHEKLLYFCAEMSVSWLCQHIYELHQHKPAPFPKTLCLKMKVFWGKKFQVQYLEEKFRTWKNKSLNLATPQKKNEVMSGLRLKLKGKSKGDIKASLLQALSSYDSSEEEELDDHPFFKNEDDCYGIDLS